MEQGGGEDQHDEAEHGDQQGNVLFGDQADQQGQDTQRRQPHDPADDPQQQIEELLHQLQDAAVALAAGDQGDADENRKHQHRQDIAIGKGFEGVLEQAGEEVLEELRHRHLPCFEGVHGIGEQIQRHAGARFGDIGHHQRQQHGQARGEHEIQQGGDPDPVNLVMCLQARYPDHDGGEHQGNEHHLQQADEHRTHQRAAIEHTAAQLVLLGHTAEQQADQHTKAGGDEYQAVQAGHISSPLRWARQDTPG